jgi:hypothetical protein
MSFLFRLSSRALEPRARLPTPSHYHAAAVRSLIYLVLAFSLCTYIYSTQSPSPTPPKLPLLYKRRASRQGSTHVYKPSLLLVEQGIDHRSFIGFNQEFFSLFYYSSLCSLGDPHSLKDDTVDDSRAALRLLDGRVGPGGDMLHVGLSRPPAVHPDVAVGI